MTQLRRFIKRRWLQLKNNKILTLNQLKGLLGNGKTINYDYECKEGGKQIWIFISLFRLPKDKKVYVSIDKTLPNADLDEHIEEIHLNFGSVEDALEYIKKNTKLDVNKYIKD